MYNLLGRVYAVPAWGDSGGMMDWRPNQVDMIFSTRNGCSMIINTILELIIINPDHNGQTRYLLNHSDYVGAHYD